MRDNPALWDCLFCEHRGLTAPGLALHLTRKHDRQAFGGGWFMCVAPLTPDILQVSCWCGRRCRVHLNCPGQGGQGAFWEHLEERGGLAAHILELALGVYDG